MKKILLATCMMFLVFGFSGIAVAGDIPVPILNGSFEDGYSGDLTRFDQLSAGDTLAGWNLESGDIDWIADLWQASDGRFSLDLNGEQPGAISQSFSTLAGGTYDVTFDLAGNPGRAYDKVLEVSAWDGQQLIASKEYTFDQNGQTKTAMGWTTPEDFSFIGTGDDVRLVFASLTDGDGGPALDNVRVTDAPPPEGSQAPEPASMLLLGTGLIGLAGVGRKKFFMKKS